MVFTAYKALHGLKALLLESRLLSLGKYQNRGSSGIILLQIREKVQGKETCEGLTLRLSWSDLEIKSFVLPNGW